jgi:flagellar protein FliS
MMNNANVYRKNEVKTSNRLDVLVMLYDGAVRFMTQAKELMKAHNVPGKGQAISKALAIINEFKNTLSFDYDRKLATDLERLYTFIQEKLQRANMSNDMEALNEALKITTILRDGWKELQQQGAGQAAAEAKVLNKDNYFRISV